MGLTDRTHTARRLLRLSSAAAGLLLAGCGGAGPAPASAPASAPARPAASTQASAAAPPAGSAAAAKPSGAAPAYKFTIAYTAPSAAFTAIWVAADENIFSKHGIEADVRNIDSNVVSAAMLSGELQFSASPSVLSAMVAGSDLTFFGRLTRAPVFSLYGTKGIPRVEDLKGKVVADTMPGSAPDVAVHDLFERHGLKDTDVQLIHTANTVAEFAALQSGQAVAAIVPPPVTLQARNAGFVELTNTVKEGTPGLSGSLGTRKSRMNDDPASVQAIIAVFKEATAFMKSQPQRTKEILGKYTKTDPGPDLDETYASYESNWEVGPVPVADVSAALRYLPDARAGTTDPARFIDNSIIESMR
jgi:NitT/TauT family transport system substrate-binding protein